MTAIWCSLLVAKVLMIVHLARHKGIGTGTDGGRQQEVARSSTDCHLPDGTAQQFVGHHTLHLKRLLEHQQEVVGCHRRCEVAHDAFSAFHHSRLAGGIRCRRSLLGFAKEA